MQIELTKPGISGMLLHHQCHQFSGVTTQKDWILSNLGEIKIAISSFYITKIAGGKTGCSLEKGGAYQTPARW